MAIKWISYIWEKTDYRDGSALVALALADFANEEGFCRPKMETVAKKSRLSVRHVQRIIKDFETDGFLEVVRKSGRGKEPEFQLKKVTSVTPFKDRKKVTSVTIKGDICDIKKVTSVTPSLNKDEPFNEPYMNRVARATEQALGFALDNHTQTRLAEAIPEQLKPEWIEFIKNRMVGNQNAHSNYLKSKLGFWLTDFQRDHKKEFEKLKTGGQLKSLTEVENERETFRKTQTRKSPGM